MFCPKYSSPCLYIPGNKGPDGTAIFYKLSLFRINSMICEKIILNDEINSQVFIVLQLLHKPSNKLITIVAVHLKSKIQNFEKREQQIKEILKAVKIHCSNLNINDHPLIMCGDFNGAPFEKFYSHIINDGTLTNLKDAYSIIADKKEPTTIKIRNSEMLKREIDYIFFNQNSLKLSGYLDLPKNNELIKKVGLPNLQYSSDHLSLVCDFSFVLNE